MIRLQELSARGSGSRKIRALPSVLLAIFATWGILSACSSSSNPSAGAGNSTLPISLKDEGEVAFDLASGLVYVPVTLRDKKLSFCLDTGAPTVIDLQRARQMGLGLESGFIASGVGASRFRIYMVHGVSLSVGGISLQNLSLESFGLKEFEPAIDRTWDGILGREIFGKYVVEIDYNSRQVRFFKPAGYSYGGAGQGIAVSIEDGYPYVSATVKLPGRESVSGRFLIDTGANGAMTLYSGFSQSHDLLNAAPKTLTITGKSLGGATSSIVGRAEAVEIGSYRFEKPIVEFSKDASGALADSRYAGLIGVDLLSRFKVIFDYSRTKLILEPNSLLSKPFEHDMSGLDLIANGPDFKTITVRTVRPDSPAFDEGIQAGDVISSLDGVAAQRYTLDQIKTTFKNDGAVISLMVKRGAKTFEMKVRLRRMI
jgi:hypothetical protein